MIIQGFIWLTEIIDKIETKHAVAVLRSGEYLYREANF